jgi:hypothetical protein
MTIEDEGVDGIFAIYEVAEVCPGLAARRSSLSYIGYTLFLVTKRSETYLVIPVPRKPYDNPIF